MVKTLESLEQRRLRFGSLGALDFLITRERERLAALGVTLPIERISAPPKRPFAQIEVPSFDKQIKLARSTGHFHANWYRRTYQGFGNLGDNAIAHYLREGAKLGLNPGKNFDTRFYLQTYPDAASSGLNPLVHFALYGQKAGYATKPKKQNPHKQISVIRTKLLSLGFTERPLAELTDIATTGDDPVARSMAARELALWHMRAKTKHGYRVSLSWIARSRLHAPDLEFRTRLSTVELLCHFHLHQRDEGLASYERARLAGESAPDLLLARANFENTPKQRVKWINKVLFHYSIEPVTLLPDRGLLPYDRLTCASPLAKITDGPKVTVLIAAFDAAEMLPTALRSLQEQTWQNLEIIVLDDCSPTMDTVRVAERFAVRDPRIQVVRMPQNGGAYVARNHGLDMATGEFVTLHDADDWSHPRKIETQVRFMMEHPEVMGCTTEQARASSDLGYTRWTGAGRFIITNTSSFMFRRSLVKAALGYWDRVRFSGDNEFIRRIRNHFGNESVVFINSGPFSFQRDSDSSIVADEVMGINGFLFGARKLYSEAQAYGRRKSAQVEYANSEATRNFPAPDIIRLGKKHQQGQAQHIPVIIGSDFRMVGGSTVSCIEEMKLHRKLGLRTAIFEMYRYDLFSPGIKTSMMDDVFAAVDGKNVRILTFGEKASCDLLILRYPPILQDFQRYIPTIDAKEIKVIVNQPPMSDYGPDGVIRYELHKCAENIRRYFGKDATWHPIGPLVREALHTHHADQLQHITLSDQDWHNIIDISGWDRGRRQRGPKDRLRVGRHSRDHAHKWPDRPEDILAAYPNREDVEIHVLGGSNTPTGIIGHIPQNWTVHEFGSIHPRDFLRDIDVWVYFAHPGWVESFGRTIIEAMAVGVPVILPEIYRPLFQDSAIYATPKTAVETARKLHADPAAYEAQADKARRFVAAQFSHEMHIERLQAAGVRPERGRE